MKKVGILLLVLSFVLVFSFTSLASSHNNYGKVITVNPAGLILGQFNLSYENIQSNRRTYVISGSYYSYSSTEWDITGIGGEIGMRIYNENNAPRGFYYGPIGSIVSVNATYDDIYGTESSGSGLTFGFGGSAGYQWITDNDLAVSLEAGALYNTGSITADGETAPYGSGVSPLIKFNIGKAF